MKMMLRTEQITGGGESNEFENILGQYFDLQAQIFEYFGYKEDWRILPIVLDINMYWQLNLDDGKGPGGHVHFADNPNVLRDEEEGDYYSNEIYTQRHLPKWIYRGKDYTMIVVDTNVDRNQYLQIFSNKLELVG